MALDTPRSGDAVLTSAERLVPLLALLSPWIDGTVAWLQAQLTYTTFGTGYTEVVQAAIVAYLPVLLGRWHMARIRQTDQQTPAREPVSSVSPTPSVLPLPTSTLLKPLFADPPTPPSRRDEGL